MKNYNVPFYSQHKHVPFVDWKNRGCGITALKMLLDFWHLKNPCNRTASLAELIRKRTNGAFIKNVGWSHSGLVSIARNYGYDGFNKDLALLKIKPQQVFEQLKKDLEYFPVIASVWNNFNPVHQGGHLVVVTGINSDRIYLNDPKETNKKSGSKVLSKKEFIKAFKKRYVAIYPTDTVSRLEKMKIFNIDVPRSYLAMIKNSPGAKIFKNLYVNMPDGKTDVLKNGNLSCAIFVSSILYQWGLIANTHAGVKSTIKDMLDFGWHKIKKPKPGCVIEWEPKLINGNTNGHLGFYLGKNKAISNRIERGSPILHHWTYGIKNGKPVRKIINLFWNNKLSKL